MTPLTFRLHLSGRLVVVFGGGSAAAVRAQELAAGGARVRWVWPHRPDDAVIGSDIEFLAEDPAPEHLRDSWLASLCTDDPDLDATIANWAGEQRIWCEGGAVPTASPALALPPQEPSRAGAAVLVGGGPGDLELLTLRGFRELATADVIIADRLGPADQLSAINPTAQVINVGKQPYHHPIPQEEINRLLIEHAQAGRRVVRLKGGDPYLLGRGGEEVLACRSAGVEVTVVPGVTSAFAAPLAAGIPVTHRSVATGVLVISGHDELSPDLLAAWPGTVVVLMGMARLAEFTAALVRAGRDPLTPAAVVASAWTPQQQSVRAPLSQLATAVAEAGLRNPAVIVIGDVVSVLEG